VALPFDPLVEIIHSKLRDCWKKRNEKALAALFGATSGAKPCKRTLQQGKTITSSANPVGRF
jgi:hypothetical protein